MDWHCQWLYLKFIDSPYIRWYSGSYNVFSCQVAVALKQPDFTLNLPSGWKERKKCAGGGDCHNYRVINSYLLSVCLFMSCRHLSEEIPGFFQEMPWIIQFPLNLISNYVLEVKRLYKIHNILMGCILYVKLPRRTSDLQTGLV